MGQDKRHPEIKDNIITMSAYNKKEDAPVVFTDTNNYYKGAIFQTVEGYYIQILEYVNKENVLVKFLDTGYERYVRMGSIWKHAIKNPYRIMYHGGYFGVGPYTKRQHMKIYSSWYKMLERLMEENQINNSRNQKYANCGVDPMWLNYQIFAFWFDLYISSLNPDYYDDYQIDKDISQWNMPYKVYSPYTCHLIPTKLNILLADLDATSRGKRKYDLPMGVIQNKSGKFCTNQIVDKQKTEFLMFSTPEEAFEAYKKIKGEYIMKLANEYLADKRIRIEVYELLQVLVQNIMP